MEKTSNSLQNILLICGVTAFILYISADILAGKLWHNYSFIYQSRSELSAIGSSERHIILPFDIIYSILILAFGLGIWRLAGGIFVKITASLIILHAVIHTGMAAQSLQ